MSKEVIENNDGRINIHEELRNLHGSFDSSEGEEEEDFITMDDEKVRTNVEEDFDKNLVPAKIMNPMKNKRRTDSTALRLAKLGQLSTIFTMFIGFVAIIMSFVRG